MEIKDEIVHVLTIVAFPLQIIAWICFASYRQEHLVLAVVLPVFLSLFAHCVYYLKAIMQREKIYLKHFFYFQVINGVSMWVVFIVKLFGYFYNWWLLLIPLFVQVGACVALYTHVRKTVTEDPTRQYNGPIPTNDQSGTYQNMPREFHAFPTEQKEGNGFL
ncbi:hypothetical protein PRIPAC_85678 [Pristionchus pacificus]|uniref:Uncharacterized protein n=1 Tax=Pristionchus pacificus TaxID=54126 RepID=A0A2A6BGX7_PRIPA|nr:hypothetical protein PRIPAC_85678 [Pristionchus pacificus]|eukprot:PDM65137.1 hypothetical protein PRIPAC_53386 [Pristionchus pacificus]